jgi:thiol peroxidase
MTVRRLGGAYEAEERLTVRGAKLEPSDPAPDFELDSLPPGAEAPEPVRLADSAGRVRLLHVVNSLDTPVCHLGAHRFEQIGASLPEDVTVYTVSMDLPYAAQRWQLAEGVDHPALSAHRSERFGSEYGVLLEEWRLLQRAVFVIDADDRIVHAEYVEDQRQEPDYDAAAEAARRASRHG